MTSSHAVAVWAEAYAHAVSEGAPSDSAEWHADLVQSSTIGREAAVNSGLGESAVTVKAALKRTPWGRLQLWAYQRVTDQIVNHSRDTK